MTDTRRTPSPPGFAQHLHPSAAAPGRWEAEHARALRTGHVRDHTCTAECEPVLVYERTRWGWLAWTVPGDGSRPELPHHIGVLTPSATPTQRMALRWLTRRPARRIGLAPGIRASLRFGTVAVAFFSLVAGLFAMADGIPADVTLPAILLAPLLAEHLPATLDARAREHVRSVEGASSCRYLQRLAALHTCLIQPPPAATATNFEAEAPEAAKARTAPRAPVSEPDGQGAQAVPEPRGNQDAREPLEEQTQPRKLPYDDPTFIAMHLARKMEEPDFFELLRLLNTLAHERNPAEFERVLRESSEDSKIQAN